MPTTPQSMYRTGTRESSQWRIQKEKKKKSIWVWAKQTKKIELFLSRYLITFSLPILGFLITTLLKVNISDEICKTRPQSQCQMTFFGSETFGIIIYAFENISNRFWAARGISLEVPSPFVLRQLSFQGVFPLKWFFHCLPTGFTFHHKLLCAFVSFVLPRSILWPVC